MSLISVFPLGLYQFLVLFLGCLFLSFCIFLPLNVCFFVQSVGFTAAPLFLISAFWFLGFGMYLLIICFRHCCSQRQHYVYEKKSNALSLSFLVLFTTATMLQFLSLSLSLSLFLLNLCLNWPSLTPELFLIDHISVLDAWFYTPVRESSTVVQQVHWSTLWSTKTALSRILRMYQIIFLQPSSLEWTNISCLPMSRPTLTISK